MRPYLLMRKVALRGANSSTWELMYERIVGPRFAEDLSRQVILV